MKKAIFIDWNGTLSYSLFWEHLRDPQHPQHSFLEPIEKWLFIDNRNIIDPWMRGVISVDKIVDRMSKDTGIPFDVIMDELRYSCENMQFCLPNIIELIDAIRRSGVLAFIATDNMDTFTRFTVPALKINALFDGVISSHETGYLKDDMEPIDNIAFF